MKAVIYPFRRNDAIIQLAAGFSGSWTGRSVGPHEEFAREIADAEILVTSNRVCTPAYGEALRTSAAQLGWMSFQFRPGSSAASRSASRKACGSRTRPASRPPWCPSTR